jgi:hypothetical protein
MANSVKTQIEISELNEDGKVAVLTLETNKANRGISSFAQLAFRQSDGCITFQMFGDFSSRLFHDKMARATQKAIDTQHAQVFTPAKIAEITTTMFAHYAKRATDK